LQEAAGFRVHHPKAWGDQRLFSRPSDITELIIQNTFKLKKNINKRKDKWVGSGSTAEIADN
jgi:hypothetical protein